VTINIYWNGSITVTNPHYRALSDRDKLFLCPTDMLQDMSLVGVMMMTRLGFVTPDTIKHMVGRLDFANGKPILDRLTERERANGSKDFEDYLQRYVGVSSNIETLTSKKFVELATFRDIPELKAPEIRAMYKRARL